MVAKSCSIFDVFKCYKLSDNVFLPLVADKGYILVKHELYEVDKLMFQLLKSLPLTRKYINNCLSYYNKKHIDLLINNFLERNIIKPESWFNIVRLRITTLFHRYFKQVVAYPKRLFDVYLLAAKCYLIKRKLHGLKVDIDLIESNKPTTILLILYGGIGDIVLATPMLQVLKKIIPRALIDVVIKAKYASFLEPCPLINRIIIYPGYRNVYKWPGKPSPFLMSLYQKYDITIGCCEHFGGACRWFTGKALSYLIDAKMRIGTLDRVSVKYPYITKHFLTHGIEERYEHEAIRMLRLLKPLGAVHFEHRAAVWGEAGDESTLNKFNLSPEVDSNTYMVGVSPFTGIGKQWPIDRYAKLIKYLLSNFNVTVILLGTKKNQQEAAILRCLIGENDNVIDLTGMTSAKELITIISTLSLLVSPDSGPAHIAAACQIAEIVLFGHTNPHRYRPWMNQKSVLLRARSKKVEDISEAVVCKIACKILVENNEHTSDLQQSEKSAHVEQKY
jgi:ADP-heptose:LPS heptosyltransferase